MWYVEVVCNNHSPTPIYGVYLPQTGVYCGACCAPGAVNACCTCHMSCCTCRMCCLERTWWCQFLLHLAYVLAICRCCGAWSVPGAVSACCTWHVCWLYVCIVVLGVHLIHMLALCRVGCLLCKKRVALAKFQTFPISYGVTGHVCILWGMYALTLDKVNLTIC